jgi:hypothetical protein
VIRTTDPTLEEAEMLLFKLNAIAEARGEGLHPKLKELLLREHLDAAESTMQTKNGSPPHDCFTRNASSSAWKARA